MSFGGLAPVYRALETIVFGNTLQCARVAQLNHIRTPTRALLAGEGNGRFLAEFVRAFPQCEVICIDGSERMLERARQRLGRPNPRVRFLQADLLAPLKLTDKHDVIFTHFVLDCFEGERLESVVRHLAQIATPDAQWVITDFAIPSRGWMQMAARLLIGAMYLFFRLTTEIRATNLIDPSPILAETGFALRERRLFLRGLLTADLRQRG